MKTLRSLVSFFARANDNFRQDHLKLCFLWYDEVMIESINDHDRANYVDSIVEKEKLEKKHIRIFTDIIVPLEEKVSKDLLQEYSKSKDHTYPRWGDNLEKFTYPSPENAKQYAHNALLEHIQREWGFKETDGTAIEHAEGRARVAIDAIILWEIVQHEVQCIMEANNDEKLAMASANIFNTKEKDSVNPFILFKTSVPDMGNIPWSEIIEIKAQGNFDSLRNKLNEIIMITPNDLPAAQKELERLEYQATEEIIEKYRPNIKKVAMESLMSNIPNIPFINPIGVFFAIRDTIEEKKKYRIADLCGWTLYIVPRWLFMIGFEYKVA